MAGPSGVLFVYHAPVAPKSLRARSADAMGRKLDRPLRRFRHFELFVESRFQVSLPSRFIRNIYLVMRS